MVGDLVEEAVQSFSSGLDEVIVEALHHAFHHKLLWQWLKTGKLTDLYLIPFLSATLFVREAFVLPSRRFLNVTPGKIRGYTR